MSLSTHPLRLITVLAWPVAKQVSPVLVARTFGIPTTGFPSESLYLGIPVMGLALLGTWHRRDLRILALLGSVALLLALGRYGGLYEIFYKVVPLWSAFRYPENLMGVASFATAMLAGAGLDALRVRQTPLAPWLATAVLFAATFIPPLADAIKVQEGPLSPGRFRLVATHEEVVGWPEDLPRTFGYYGALSIERRQALDVEHNAAFQLESIMPQLAGYSPQFHETMHHGLSFGAAARFNVTYYISRRYHLKGPNLSRTIVAELPPYDLVLFRNPVPPKPRVYLSKNPERSVKSVDPVALFARPDFLSGEVDVIETSALTLPGPAMEGLARMERYAPEEVRVRVETPQPAVLILLDSFDKGWTATLENGAELPILRANALVRAVVVPAGTHLVTFSYRTPLLKAGAAASLVGCLLCTGLITHAWWRRRQPAGPCR